MRVYAEKANAAGRFDIFLAWDEENETHGIIIEAKVDSMVRSQQMDNYDDSVAAFKKYGTHIMHKVLLTPEPTEYNDWISLTFRQIAHNLIPLLESPAPGRQLLREFIAGILKGIYDMQFPPLLNRPEEPKNHRNPFDALYAIRELPNV